MRIDESWKDGKFLRMEWKEWKKIEDGMEKDGRKKLQPVRRAAIEFNRTMKRKAKSSLSDIRQIPFLTTPQSSYFGDYKK